MKFHIFTAAVIASGALAFAAQAQTGGSMSGPNGSMMQSHTNQTGQCCTSTTNHMSGGSMAGGNHMSGGTMSGGSMSGGTTSSGSMSGGTTSGGGMTGANHMASNTNNCQSSQTSKPN